MNEVLEKAKRFLFRRRFAYHQVFNKESEFAQMVLKDLGKFCRVDKTTFHDDARLHALIEGRREVYLRILQHIELSQDELWKLMNKGE